MSTDDTTTARLRAAGFRPSGSHWYAPNGLGPLDERDALDVFALVEAAGSRARANALGEEAVRAVREQRAAVLAKLDAGTQSPEEWERWQGARQALNAATDALRALAAREPAGATGEHADVAALVAAAKRERSRLADQVSAEFAAAVDALDAPAPVASPAGEPAGVEERGRFDEWCWSDDAREPNRRLRLSRESMHDLIELSDEECNDRAEDAHSLRSYRHPSIVLTGRESEWLMVALARMLSTGMPCGCCGRVLPAGQNTGHCRACVGAKCGPDPTGERLWRFGRGCPRGEGVGGYEPEPPPIKPAPPPPAGRERGGT